MPRGPERRTDAGEDYYGDQAEERAESPAKAAETASEEAGEKGEEQTFVLPKEIAQGKEFKEGDEMVVEIVGVHEDSFEVKYAPEKGGKGEEYGEEQGAPAGPPPGMGPPDAMGGMMD